MKNRKDVEEIEVAVDYDDVVAYVDASNTLAAVLEHELKKGFNMPVEVILALNKYKQKANALQNVLDYVESSKSKLN